MENKQTIQNRIAGAAGEIHYELSGADYPALVFIHSLAGNSGHWSRQMDYFSDRFRVLALDLRGHGRSGFAAGAGAGIADLADDIQRVLDAEAVMEAILIGHSMGGLAALECAARPADRAIRGLVLVDSAGDSRAMPREMVEGILQAIRTEENLETTVAHYEQMLAPSRPEVRTKVLQGLMAISRELLADNTRSLFEYDPMPALNKFRGPIRAITTTFGEQPGALHRLRQDIPTNMMEGVGHWLHLDRPAEFNRRLEEFIREVEA